MLVFVINFLLKWLWGSKVAPITTFWPTIFLIFFTAIVGVYYAKHEGLNTLKSGFILLSKNETPAYEVLSGAFIALAAVLLIIPGFLTDLIGLLIIFPWTRKLFLKKISKKNVRDKKNFIEGEYEDIDENK